MRTNLFPLTALLLAFSLTAAAQPPAGQPSSGQAPAQTRPGETPAMPPAAASEPTDAGLVTGNRRAPPPLPDNAPTVDVFALIDRLSQEMNKEFILDPRMRGIVGYSTAGEEADYDTLLAILRTNLYVAIEVGDEIRIVSEATARAEPSTVLTRDDDRISDHAVVTLVVDVSDLELIMPDGTPASAGAAALVPVLRPLMSTAVGNITAVPGSTKVVIVDRFDNARRIRAIIDELRK
jgi:type II secretory pathway component GspD/PulD (secretin)